MKAIIKAVLVVLIVFVITAITAAGIAYTYNKAPTERAEKDRVFSVEKGESVSSISVRLEESNLVRSRYFIRLLSKLKRTEGSFRAGSYRIQGGATSFAIHDTLVSGLEIMRKVTIPEGLSRRRIAEILENTGITSQSDFLDASEDAGLLDSYGIEADSAEGFLFPDTYLFPEKFPAEQVVETMMQRFFEVLGEIEPDQEDIRGYRLQNRVILASIIEREYIRPEEAPYMASVFYNRLDEGMRLQSCATVAYALSEELGREYPERLTLKDLEVNSAYNTYLHWGLPPAPIANPGKVALSAVFDPPETTYLYFLLKDAETGSHEFTTNYVEHISAKNLFLKKN